MVLFNNRCGNAGSRLLSRSVTIMMIGLCVWCTQSTARGGGIYSDVETYVEELKPDSIRPLCSRFPGSPLHLVYYTPNEDRSSCDGGVVVLMRDSHDVVIWEEIGAVYDYYNRPYHQASGCGADFILVVTKGKDRCNFTASDKKTFLFNARTGEEIFSTRGWGQFYGDGCTGIVRVFDIPNKEIVYDLCSGWIYSPSDPMYEPFVAWGSKENLRLIVRQHGKSGIINRQREWLTPPEYKWITLVNPGQSCDMNQRFLAMVNGKQGTIDPYTGKADMSMWVDMGTMTIASCDDTTSAITQAPQYCVSTIELDGIVPNKSTLALATILVNVTVRDAATKDQIYQQQHWIPVHAPDTTNCCGATLQLPQPVTHYSQVAVDVRLLDATP